MNEKLLVQFTPRGIATLTMNRPESANCYDQDMIDALDREVRRLGGDASARVIVLRGAGKHFSGGADVRWHGNRPKPPESAPPPRSVFEVCTLIHSTPKPTVAVVQGGCLGGGMALASCCDIMLAARNAFFSIPEVRLGFSPGTSSAPIFAHAIGARNFRRYGMTGQRFGAEEALRMGLAHQLCEPEDLEKALSDQIEEILLAAPNAARNAKAIALRLGGELIPEKLLEELEAQFAGALTTPESLEGHASFLEKRKPNWYPQAG